MSPTGRIKSVGDICHVLGFHAAGKALADVPLTAPREEQWNRFLEGEQFYRGVNWAFFKAPKQLLAPPKVLKANPS